MSEWKIIDYIKQKNEISRPRARLHLGPGDDCAIVNRLDSKYQEIITQDMLLDGVHFLANEAGPELVANKCLGVNISDIAAMGGTPEHLSLGICTSRNLPASFTQKFIDELFRLCKEYNIAVSGGDTNIWDGPLVITICLSGSVLKNRAITRSGAVIGDNIYVSGPLGYSLASGSHLNFKPRLKLGQDLMRENLASSMIDLSDGLAGDLRHILKASNVGARLERSLIPLAAWGEKFSKQDRIYAALCHGEDFELCFTANPAYHETIMKLHTSPKISKIGEVTTPEYGLHWADGSSIEESGYQHC